VGVVFFIDKKGFCGGGVGVVWWGGGGGGLQSMQIVGHILLHVFV